MDSLLFSPITINGMELPNRIVMPSMVTHYAGPNGEVTDRLIRYHLERSMGGCGLNIVESTYIHKSGETYARALGADRDELLPGLRRLTAAIHAVHGHVALQLQHGGRTAKPQFSGCPQWLVSQIPSVTDYDDSREMVEEDIRVLIEAYGDAALRAKQAGFDAVELHGAHGYLLMQFLSLYTNRRTDKWGGSLENRARFALEVIDRVRVQVGRYFPVIYRMTCDEMSPDGFTLAEAEKVAPMLVEAGVDCLNVSAGRPETNQYTVASPLLPMGWMAEKAGAVRRAIKERVPVIAVGRIHSREVAERILRDGLADLVAVGRGQIADPCFGNKLKEGRDAELMTCVSCNDGCIGLGAKGLPISCAINPRAGKELFYNGVRAKTPKTFLVVGGGIAGMTAAAAAAERGHKVVLVEKTDRLGGLLNVAAVPLGKDLYASLIKSKAMQLGDVDVRLDTPVTESVLAEVRPDAIIVATGSAPVKPRFCQGAKNVLTADEVLMGAPVRHKVIILGGGLVGCETGEYLAEKGHDVTILELRDSLAAELSERARRLPLMRIRELGIKSLLRTEVVSIGGDGTVTVKDRFGREKALTGFDTVVLALGYRPVTDAHPMLEDSGIPTIYVGDSEKVGNVLSAMQSALKAAYAL